MKLSDSEAVFADVIASWFENGSEYDRLTEGARQFYEPLQIREEVEETTTGEFNTAK